MRLKELLGIAVILTPMTFVRAQLNDLQTSFEFSDTDGRFIFGQCPGCAVFENGRAEPVGSSLRLNGENAWVVAPGSTAVITFPAPAQSLDLFFKDEDGSVSSLLEILDEAGQLLETVNGSPNGPDENGFTRVQLQHSSIKRVTLRNNASPESESARAALENLIASFVQEIETITVDTFFVPRFADGSFQAGGLSNEFTTEAILVNSGPFAVIQLDSFSDAGIPNPVTLETRTGNRGTDSGFSFPLVEGETTAYRTVGLGDGSPARNLNAGYWRIEVKRTSSDVDSNGGVQAGVGGTGVFARSQQESEAKVLLFETGVAAVHPLQEFSLSLDSTGDKDTGLALVNPPLPEGSAEDGTAEIVLSVWDSSGESLVASIEFELQAGEAVSKFIWEYVRDLGGAEVQGRVDELREADGVVTVRSSRAVAPLTLRQNNPDSTFPEGVPTLTTFPVVRGAADSNVSQ